MKFAGIIVLFVYSMLTFVGVGIFHCGCTHSQGLVVMAVQTACPPCTGTTESCCSHNDQYHDDDTSNCEDEDCCTVEYQFLDVDQLNVSQFHEVKAKVVSLAFSPFLLFDSFYSAVSERFIEIKNNSPPVLFNIPFIYMYAQLRL